MSAGQSGVTGTLPVVLNLTQLEAKIMLWAVGTKLPYISFEYLDSSLY